MIVQKTKQQPKKSAACGGRLLVRFWGLKYNHFLDFPNKKYRYWVYLMEHIFSEVDVQGNTCFLIYSSSYLQSEAWLQRISMLCTSLVLYCIAVGPDWFSHADEKSPNRQTKLKYSTSPQVGAKKLIYCTIFIDVGSISYKIRVFHVEIESGYI